MLNEDELKKQRPQQFSNIDKNKYESFEDFIKDVKATDDTYINEQDLIREQNTDEDAPRQKCQNVYGTENDLYHYIESDFEEDEYYNFLEAYNPNQDWIEDYNAFNNNEAYFDDKHYETYADYLKHLNHPLSINSLFFDYHNLQLAKERLMGDDSLNQKTKHELSKMTKAERIKYKRLRMVRLKMLQYHMLEKLLDVLSKDKFFSTLQQEWYRELICKADKQEYNKGYLKGYAAGHRDGFNDCMRAKEEFDYEPPLVEKSEFPVDNEIKLPPDEEIPF